MKLTDIIKRKVNENRLRRGIRSILEASITRRFQKAVEALQKIQLDQQKLRKAFVAEKNPKRKEVLKKAIIKMHHEVKKAEEDFNRAMQVEPVEYIEDGKIAEGRGKKVTRNMWNRMSDDEKIDALLTVVEDPKEAMKYYEKKWNDLPSGFIDKNSWFCGGNTDDYRLYKLALGETNDTEEIEGHWYEKYKFWRT